MRKFWLVFAHEYWRQISQRRFFLALLSLPVLGFSLLVYFVFILFIELYSKPIGYVDYSQFLKSPAELNSEDTTFVSWHRFVEFSSEEEARQSLEAGKIQAYYVVAEDYLESGKIRLIARESLPEAAGNSFTRFLRQNMVNSYPDQVQERLLYPTSITVSTPDESIRSDSKPWFQLIYPFAGTIMLLIVVTTSGEYMLKSIVEEKENRTIEILITSVSTQTLMMAKTLGNMCVGLTQLLIWMLYPLWAGVILWAGFPSVTKTELLGLPFVLSLVLMLLAFVLVSSVLVIIGAVTTEYHDSQQISTLVVLVLMAPFYALYGILFHPNWWLAIGMSLFPFTAPMVMPLRISLTVVPVWQILLCIGLLVASAVGGLFLAGRAFRLGMLRYGKPIGLNELLRRG